MTTVAVVAHAGKTFGGGLPELRDVLRAEGVDPLWYEVPKSKYAPKAVRRALKKGADVVLAWGGDGMQQRCIEVLAGTDVPLGILPAGTGNLLATNLDVPMTVAEAVAVALHGDRVALDTGLCNGEHFAVMAGAGFDALMIKDADRGLKDRIGRAAYLWTGLRNISAAQVQGKVKVDGNLFYKGQLSCVLVGNVSKVFAGIEAFDGARPDDGRLEVGVVSASSPVDPRGHPRRGRPGREVAVHRRDERQQDPRHAEEEARLRDRRRRPTPDAQAAHRRPPRLGRGVRASEVARDPSARPRRGD